MDKRMIDGHIHIERGEYSLDWIRHFVDRAVETGLTEIRLLEHNFLFPEFAPMYDSVRAPAISRTPGFKGSAERRTMRSIFGSSRGCGGSIFR